MADIKVKRVLRSYEWSAGGLLRNVESQKDVTNKTAASVYKYTNRLHD